MVSLRSLQQWLEGQRWPLGASFRVARCAVSTLCSRIATLLPPAQVGLSGVAFDDQGTAYLLMVCRHVHEEAAMLHVGRPSVKMPAASPKGVGQPEPRGVQSRRTSAVLCAAYGTCPAC